MSCTWLNIFSCIIGLWWSLYIIQSSSAIVTKLCVLWLILVFLPWTKFPIYVSFFKIWSIVLVVHLSVAREKSYLILSFKYWLGVNIWLSFNSFAIFFLLTPFKARLNIFFTIFAASSSNTNLCPSCSSLTYPYGATLPIKFPAFLLALILFWKYLLNNFHS